MGIRVKLIQYDEEAPKIIAAASKMSISRKAIEELTSIPDEEVEVWIKETLKRGHLSPWEHSSYTFMVEGCSRVCSHQLVRHRIASYTQQSMRYTEASLREMAIRAAEEVGLECPRKPKGDAAREAYACYAQALRKASDEVAASKAAELASDAYVIPPSVALDQRKLEAYARSLLAATSSYYSMLSIGVPKEDARFVIPMSVRTKVTFTMNARELIQSFLPLRMCTRAQWEIRYVAWQVWRELARVHPQLFKYAGPSCVFLNNALLDEPKALEDYLKGAAPWAIARCPELITREKIPSCLSFAARALEGDFYAISQS